MKGKGLLFLIVSLSFLLICCSTPIDSSNVGGDTSGSNTNQVAKPVFSINSGTYNSIQTVTISCDTNGASIYFDAKGDTPTSQSTLYTSTLTVNTKATIKAIAIKDGMSNSEVATVTYDFNPVQSGKPVIYFWCKTSSTTEYDHFFDMSFTKDQYGVFGYAVESQIYFQVGSLHTSTSWSSSSVSLNSDQGKLHYIYNSSTSSSLNIYDPITNVSGTNTSLSGIKSYAIVGSTMYFITKRELVYNPTTGTYQLQGGDLKYRNLSTTTDNYIKADFQDYYVYTNGTDLYAWCTYTSGTIEGRKIYSVNKSTGSLSFIITYTEDSSKSYAWDFEGDYVHVAEISSTGKVDVYRCIPKFNSMSVIYTTTVSYTYGMDFSVEGNNIMIQKGNKEYEVYNMSTKKTTVCNLSTSSAIYNTLIVTAR